MGWSRNKTVLINNNDQQKCNDHDQPLSDTAVTFYSSPPILPPAQITTCDQFRSYSKKMFIHILQVRDELCLAHEAFQFFRKFNQNPMIRKNALDIFFQAEIPISLWGSKPTANHLQRVPAEEESRLISNIVTWPTIPLNWFHFQESSICFIPCTTKSLN